MPLYLPGGGAAGPMTAAIEALATTGLIDRTGSGTATTRTAGTTGLAVLAAADEAAARTAIGSPAFAGDSTATITTNSVIRSQIDSSGNVTSTIPGGSTLLPEFKCRAWVNFDGSPTLPTIRASGNVSSVTRNGTGDYTVNFTTAMPDANYSVSGICGLNDDFSQNTPVVRIKASGITSASSFSFFATNNNLSGGGFTNMTNITIQIFR